MNKTEKKFRSIVEKLYKEGKSIPEIKEAVRKLYPGANNEWLYNKCKKAVYKLQGRYSNGSNPKYKPSSKETIPELGTITGKGRTRYKNNDNLLTFVVEGKELPSDEEILNAFGLSADEYEITQTTAEVNERYYVSIDDYRPYTKCRVKISQRESYKLQKMVDNIAMSLDYKNVPAAKLTVKHEDSDNRCKVLEIDLADFHYGLRALASTTGEEYSCEIAKETLFSALDGLVNEVKGEKFKKVIFATLGDFLHVDNGKQTTTAGTFQQLDGDIYNVASKGSELMIQAIEYIKKEIDTPIVEYIQVQGNHDRETGTMLGNVVKAAFRNDDTIICDVEPNPNKVRVIGGCPVVYCHGDIKNLSEILINQFRKEYLSGTHPCARIHAGHFHSLKLQSKGNIIVKNFPTICSSSIWEHQQGYNSPKALGYTVYNLNTGNISEGYIYTENNE